MKKLAVIIFILSNLNSVFAAQSFERIVAKNPSYSEVVNKQRVAMLHLYSSIDDASLRSMAIASLKANDPRSWLGVQNIDRDGYILFIDLSAKELRGTVHIRPGLQRLVQLNLSNNHISKFVLPKKLCPMLIGLNLDHNELLHFKCANRNLKTLDISHNRFQKQPIHLVLGNEMPKLSVLTAANCELLIPSAELLSSSMNLDQFSISFLAGGNTTLDPAAAYLDLFPKNALVDLRATPSSGDHIHSPDSPFLLC